MRELSKDEIKALLPIIRDVIESDAFNHDHFNDVIGNIKNSVFFRIEEHIGHGDHNDIIEECMEGMSSYEMGLFMCSYSLMYRSDEEIPYKAENLMEEQVDELLAQVKIKYDFLPNLEKALGTKLVAEVRGEEDPDPQPDEKNYSQHCYCSKVVNLEPYEIESCCERKRKVTQDQWIAENPEGQWFVKTCPCGKVSKPYVYDGKG